MLLFNQQQARVTWAGAKSAIIMATGTPTLRTTRFTVRARTDYAALRKTSQSIVQMIQSKCCKATATSAGRHFRSQQAALRNACEECDSWYGFWTVVYIIRQHPHREVDQSPELKQKYDLLDPLPSISAKSDKQTSKTITRSHIRNAFRLQNRRSA